MLIYTAMHSANEDSWYSKLPPGVKSYIDDMIEVRKVGGYSFDETPTIDLLNLSTTGHLMMIMKTKPTTTNVNFFKSKDKDSVFGISKDQFEPVWREFSSLRNIIAHHNSYPSDPVRDRWLTSVGLLENWLDHAEESFHEEE